MKKSTVMWLLLLPLFGLLPLLGGVYIKGALPMARAPEEMAAAPAPEAPYSDETLSALPDMPLPEPVASIAPQVDMTDLMAAFGAINTAVTGGLAWFFRRREHIEEKVKSIQQDMGDLARMPFSEFWQLVFRSFRSYAEFKRLLFRTNQQYSVYGFSHVALLPKMAGRPIQWLDRTNRSAAWILESLAATELDWLSKERSLTALHRPWLIERALAVGFMQDTNETARSNYHAWLKTDNWRSEPTRTSEPSKLIGAMGDAEFAITLFFQMGDDRKEAFTLIGFGVEVPETLEQWEEFIMAFRQENKIILKNAILLSALAIHLPVE